MQTVEACIQEAIRTIQNFMLETTGEAATQGEIARALNRYFVLNEIREHIEMERENPYL